MKERNSRMFNDMQFTRQQRSVLFLFLAILFSFFFCCAWVFIVRSSESDNGATIKKYFTSILCTLFSLSTLCFLGCVDSLRKTEDRRSEMACVHSKNSCTSHTIESENEQKRHSKRIIASTFDFSNVVSVAGFFQLAKVLSHLFILHSSLSHSRLMLE